MLIMVLKMLKKKAITRLNEIKSRCIFLFLALFATTVSAGPTMAETVCEWINAIRNGVEVMTVPIALIMFTYGGAKYVFSADDPGGRKQGKNICIHTIVGVIILAVGWSVFQAQRICVPP
jgi:hypothetical protein